MGIITLSLMQFPLLIHGVMKIFPSEGGGPTLHPKFFDILGEYLNNFDYVWLATNGSQTESMYRLSNIIEGRDYESFSREDYCDCECVCKTEEEKDNCCCFDNCYCEPEGLIYQENKLSVALSQDCFHDPIDQRIVDLWTRKAFKHRHNHYEIRNVTNSTSGIVNQGRAQKTGNGISNHCVCSDIMIKPDGKIRLCGCTKSPIIGDIYKGIDEKWENIIYNNEGYRNTNCYKDID